MAFLVYTTRENLYKTIKYGIIRIPNNLSKSFDLGRIKKGNKIFFYDFENHKIYGYSVSISDEVDIEKNPKKGPFNGFGAVENHYNYKSIKVDCSMMFKKSMAFEKSLKNINFYLTRSEGKNILEKLEIINHYKRDELIINLDLSDKLLRATVVEVSKSTKIHNYEIGIKRNLFSLIGEKEKMVEYFLKNNDYKKIKSVLKEIGSLIYNNIFKNLGLERIFSEGGYVIHIAGSTELCRFPFEVCYNDSFIFEKNIVSYRNNENQDFEKPIIGRILIIADPTASYKWASKEGVTLYNLFKEMRLACDLVKRPLKKEQLIDFFQFYDIIHFAGHGTTDDDTEGWDIGHSFFTVDDILIQNHLPSLIFTSSCGKNQKIGMDFLKLGVKNIISSRWVIPDRDMSGFIINFYQMLFNQMEIGVAFNNAVNRSKKNGNLIPVLFTLYGENRLIYESKNT